MNLARSSDPLRKPQMIVSEWIHNDPHLEVTHRIAAGQAEVKRNFVYYTDGREALNTTPVGEASSIAFWRGDSLILVTTQRLPNGSEMVLNHRYSLAEDGRVLVMERYLPEQDGEVIATLIFDRE